MPYFREIIESVSKARENAEGIEFRDGDSSVTILVLRRKKNTTKAEFVTETCPFCGMNHSHCRELGHRVAHCPDWDVVWDRTRGWVVKYILGKSCAFMNKDGQVFKASDGYYLKFEDET